jgi:hypothetical protein
VRVVHCLRLAAAVVLAVTVQVEQAVRLLAVMAVLHQVLLVRRLVQILVQVAVVLLVIQRALISLHQMAGLE